MRIGILGLTVFFVFFTSCKDEPAEPGLPSVNGHSVLVLNEGNFQWGNASLSVYDPEARTIIHKVFQKVNGRPLGDVAQSISGFGQFYYIVVNNSGSILVIDTSDFKLVDEWKGYISPRYMFHVDEQTAIVSDLYAKGVFVIDKANGSVKSKIGINGWTDRMIRYKDDLFVTNRDGKAIYRIDLITFRLKDSIVVSDQPNQMVIDAENKLWVLCSGKTGEGNGALWVLDADNGELVQKFSMNVSAFINHLAIDRSLQHIFYIEKDLYKMHYKDSTLPKIPSIKLEMKTPYHLKIDQINDDIYISDAKDFLSNSTLKRYTSNGTTIDVVETGIIAGDVYIGE